MMKSKGGKRGKKRKEGGKKDKKKKEKKSSMMLRFKTDELYKHGPTWPIQQEQVELRSELPHKSCFLDLSLLVIYFLQFQKT